MSMTRLKDFWQNSPRANASFLALMILLQILIHVPMLHLSPRGMHVWRQVVGSAAIQNYMEEEDSFWNPRADIRLSSDDTGRIYHEFPLTYWLAAKTAKAGLMTPDMAGHVYQLLFNLLMIPGAFYFLIALHAGRNRAALFTFLLTFSPLYLAYAPLLEPNMLGLSFFLLALACYLPAVEEGSYRGRFAIGTLLLILATLAKPTYLFFGLPVAAWVLPEVWRQKRLGSWLALGVSGFFIGAANLLVFRHAKTLYEASPWQRQFHTPIAAPPIPSDWNLIGENVQKAATTWFLEMNLNLGAIPFLFLALVLIFQYRSDNNRARNFWLAWTLSLLIFCTMFVVRLADHDYYITASLPLAAWLSSFGAKRWIQSGKHKWVLLFFLLIAVPYLGVTRAYGRFFGKPQVPATLLEHAEEIAKVIPKTDLILVDGDKTPIVFLYYLKRKGLSLSQAEGKLTAEELKPFRWLVRYNDSEALSPHANLLRLKNPVKIRDFTVFSIQGVKDGLVSQP